MMVYERATLRIVAVSDAAVAGYGYSREEFLALTLRDLDAGRGARAARARSLRPS